MTRDEFAKVIAPRVSAAKVLRQKQAEAEKSYAQIFVGFCDQEYKEHQREENMRLSDLVERHLKP